MVRYLHYDVFTDQPLTGPRLVPPDRAGHMVSRQGVKMERPSRVHIRIAGTPDEITDVKVGGASVLVGDGRITRI